MPERNTGGRSANTDLTRRSYVTAVSAAGVAFGTSGLLGDSSGKADAVDLGDEGLEDGDEIDGYLEDYFESGAEVHIPPGEYDWSGDGLGGDYENAALIGDGDPGAVSLHLPDGGERYSALKAQAGEVRIENLTIRGETGDEDSKLRAEARAEDATMVVKGIRLPDGVEEGSTGNGLFVGPEHAGTVKFVDCYVEGFADNGLYADSPGKDEGEGGKVVVEGGLYKNNNISNVRIGAPDSEVREVTLVHDDEAPENDGSINQRNLRIRQPGEGLVVEDCDIVHTIDSNSPVDFSSQLEGEGNGVIKDTRIYTESSGSAVTDTDSDWEVENVHVTGEGDHSIGIEASGVCEGSDCSKATPDPVSSTLDL